MDIPALANGNRLGDAGPSKSVGFASLGSEDFFKLMIADLLAQDPLKPMDNQKLLEQIASIRDIEASSQVSDSLHSLIQQQRFGSASGLIGHYVEALSPQSGSVVSGVVTGVAFGANGLAVLELDTGDHVALSDLQLVRSLEQIAKAYVGQWVSADTIQDGALQRVEGVVTEVKSAAGAIMLELDNGEQVPLSAVTERRHI